MKTIPIAITALTTLLVTGLLVAASAQDKQPKDKKEADKKDPDKKEAIYVSSADAKYVEVIPGVSRAVITGDPEKGAYQAFTKFAPGASFALHSHPNEMTMVVLKGAYVYKPEKGEERRVGAGSCMHFPAGDRHVSGGDAKEGALFFEESSGKFGLDYVEAPKK